MRPTCLIPFKAKAWLDLSEQKAQGEHVDGKNIKKHKNDVFRLAQLLTAETRQELSAEIADDMSEFLARNENEDIDLKSIGFRGASKERTLEVLRHCYGLDQPHA